MGCYQKKHTIFFAQPHYISKWILESDLFNVDHITYDHHLLLLTRCCMQTTHNGLSQSLLTTYSHPQHKVRQYILPTLHIPLLTLLIRKCTPNQYMITSHPTIHIHPPFTQIHDHTYQTSTHQSYLIDSFDCWSRFPIINPIPTLLFTLTRCLH